MKVLVCILPIAVVVATIASLLTGKTANTTTDTPSFYGLVGEEMEFLRQDLADVLRFKPESRDYLLGHYTVNEVLTCEMHLYPWSSSKKDWIEHKDRLTRSLEAEVGLFSAEMKPEMLLRALAGARVDCKNTGTHVR
ncbi:hypothetical protein MMC10_003228 [Thelotrema lepadinum]|nr:hypothetical protein [Thelotrema lepadinum]